MTTPIRPETGEEKRERVANNIAAYKAAIDAGTHTRADLDAYLASERESPAVERDANDYVGAAAQTALDAATFGLEGLTEDALTKGDFSENRKLRAENKRALEGVGAVMTPLPNNSMMSIPVATAARVGGALLNPVGRVLGPVKKGAGLIRTAAKALLEGGAQAGLQAVGENAGREDDPLGLRAAARAIPLGMAAGGTVGIASGLRPQVDALRRAASGKNLGEAADEIARNIEQRSAAAYAIPKAEAAEVGGTTPAVRSYLDTDPDIAPYARMLRRSKAFRDADDATILREAHKLLSEAEGNLGATIDASPRFKAKASVQKKDIPLIKADLLGAAESPSRVSAVGGEPITVQPLMPSLRPAIEQHSMMKGEQEAFNTGADMADLITGGKNVKSKDLLTKSPKAWEREIEGYSPEQAKAALRGVLGRLKEIPELTSNPVGRFGIVSSTARTVLAPSRIRRYIRLLDEKSGAETVEPFWSDKGPSALGRIVGGMPR